MDIVIREPTCRLLKAARSLDDPSHHILYEEWDDYDEFVNVQLNREYRRDFAERMSAFTAAKSSVEIFEVVNEVRGSVGASQSSARESE